MQRTLNINEYLPKIPAKRTDPAVTQTIITVKGELLLQTPFSNTSPCPHAEHCCKLSHFKQLPEQVTHCPKSTNLPSGHEHVLFGVRTKVD